MDSVDAAHELTCIDCGAGVRPIDRFCSQCGRRDPTGTDDSMLTEPTLIAEEPTLMKTPVILTPSEARGKDLGAGDPFASLRAGSSPSARLRMTKGKTVELRKMLVPGSIF